VARLVPNALDPANANPVSCRTLPALLDPPRPRPNRDNAPVRIERGRENVFTVTATNQELSLLVAAARMAYEAMQSAPEPPPPEALEALRRVLSEFDTARERLTVDEPPEGG
jgi:hypothetical protein